MASTPPITADDLSGMVEHWLSCPPNGYYGSDYGSPIKDILQSPQSGAQGDELIAKCRADIPLLSQAAPGSLNLYMRNLGIDRKELIFAVAGREISISEA